MDWSGTLGTPVEAMESGTPKVMNLPAFDGYADPKKLAIISKIAERAGRDPQLATVAVGIFRKYGVPPRDYRGQLSALLRWVQETIYYVNEPDERLQDPFYTLKVGYADCFPASTLLLAEGHSLVPIKDVKPGMRVWGKDRWSLVEAVEDKGVLPVTHIRLTNGSTLRLTEGHKVYVEVCSVHGAGCSLKNPCCKSVGQERVRVSDLREGAVLITPTHIPFGTTDMDSGVAYVEGLYLSDGSISHKYTKKNGDVSVYDFSIAGRDGKPKEAQKAEVAAICDRLGLTYRIGKKEIAVHGAKWATRLSLMGTHAPEKHALSIDLSESAAASLLRGIMADSGRNTSGGVTFTSTSYRLALQTRLLWKMFGRTCGYRYVENHGGLGKHPVHRLNPRLTLEDGAQKAEKLLRVKSISRGVEQLPCFDIQTDDHHVYVPDADVTVSNCDDLAILLYALAVSVRLPARLVISGLTKRGKKVRHIQGQRSFDRSVNWNHIYVQLGDRPYGEPTWFFAEPTLSVPLGWDVVGHSDQTLPEMTPSYGAPMPFYSGPGSVVEIAPSASSSAYSPTTRKTTFSPGVFSPPPTLSRGATFSPSAASSLASSAGMASGVGGPARSVVGQPGSGGAVRVSPSLAAASAGSIASSAGSSPTVAKAAASAAFSAIASGAPPAVVAAAAAAAAAAAGAPPAVVGALASPEAVAAFSAETSVSSLETVVPEGVSPDAPSAQAGGDPNAEANAVAILLVDPKGQILLLHRAPGQVFMGGAWDLPGGKVRTGASAREQAVQILAEETGIRLPAKALSVLLSAYHPTSGTTVFFVANVPESNTVSVNAPEHVAHRWVNADEGRSDMLLVPYMPLVLNTLRKAKAARGGYGFAEGGKGTGYGIAALLLAAAAAYFVGQQHGRSTR